MQVSDLALVLSGGGARAAYQVGFLRALARLFPEFAPPILTGVSAGAINATYLASRAGSFAVKAEALAELWSRLTADRVFYVDPWHLFRNVVRTGTKLVSGGAIRRHRPYASVDTAPLRRMLDAELHVQAGPLPGIERNLASGSLRALAITTSSNSTGQSVSFVQGRDIIHWERADRVSQQCRLRVDHVMASTALPIFFPAV